MRRVAAVAAVVAVAVIQASPVGAQWVANRSVDDFSGETSVMALGLGENRRLLIGVGCIVGDLTVYLTLYPTPEEFRNGDVEVRWDEGPVERHSFLHIDSRLVGSPGPSAAFIENLRSHRDLRIRVNKWRRERVTDRVSLSGSAAALDELPCMAGR